MFIRVMLKQKNNTKIARWHYLAGTIGLGLTLIGATMVVPLVRADQFDEKIQRLQDQNGDKQQAINQLEVQATSYQDAINKLEARIRNLRQQINEYQKQSDVLKKKIVKAEADLDKQKQILGQNIRAMYLEGQVSTLEMLASSKDLSDFLDKQEYRNAVQGKIRNTLDKITALKLQLRNQKQRVDQLLTERRDMSNQLSTNVNEQNRLLGLNTNQRDNYSKQIQDNLSKIAKLRAQQAAANRALGGTVTAGDPNRGGYPAIWDQAPQDSLLDNWGMYNRECVSYTAWKVYQRYGHMPYWGGHGNANQWPASARQDKIATGSEPREGSVAISMAGYYGHAMWVEYVLPNGLIHVSQYNYDLAGHYSEMTINGAGLTYIYFK